MSASGLFLTATCIWGTTWLVIKYQLGVVAPEISVVYRFTLASLLLAGWCVASGRSLGFSVRHHAWFAGLGLLMITVNYVFIYKAERVLTSGLVAVLYSTMVFMTPVAMRVAFGSPLRASTFVAATLGVGGIALLFLPELGQAQGTGAVAGGIAFTLAAVLSCCVGNLIAVRNHRAGIPTVPGTAWGLAYGAGFAALAALLQGLPWTFDARPAYVLSLVYLAVFGSVVAFLAYFAFQKRAGAGPAAYITVATPVIAMLVSTLVEGYRWTMIPALGVALAVLGNWIALRSPAKAPAAYGKDPATPA
jgi:drug/metabolite transporter (DMT)-like permease